MFGKQVACQFAKVLRHFAGPIEPSPAVRASLRASKTPAASLHENPGAEQNGRAALLLSGSQTPVIIP